MSRLESLPNDMLSEIMSRVGSHSREDLKNCMLTCKELLESVDDPKVFKTLDISPLLENPFLALGPYKNLMKKCLLHSNPSAQYVKGIVEYFAHDNPTDGFRYMREAANASIQEAVYLYGILLLCNGKFDEGKHYMEQLNWRADKAHAENCFNNIRASLHGIWIMRKTIYYRSLLAMRPPFICSLSGQDTSCEKCYYYKEMFKFLFNL